MSRVFQFLICFALLAGSTTSSLASDYVWRDGYWWLGGKAYTRSVEYYYQGRCKYSRYVYSPAVGYDYAAEVAKLKYTDPDWRTKLLDIAKQRDYFEGRMRLDALEQKEFIEAIQVLGLEGNFNWKGYGADVNYGVGDAYHHQNAYHPTPQGNTVFGYSAIADVYGNVDLNQLYEQAIRLAEVSQRHGHEATVNAHTLIREEGSWRARVAEIIAKGQAAREALQGAQATGGRVEFRAFGTTPNSAPARASNAQAEQVYSQLQSLVNDKCVKCHKADKLEGGLDLTDLSALSAEQGHSIFERIYSADPEKRMPKGAPALTRDELDLFERAAAPAE